MKAGASSRVRVSGALFIVIILWAHDARADAIVRTQAMLASTIAEYYIGDAGVEVELEIGLSDLEAFRNLLPDDLYETLGHEPRPMSERLADFFSECSEQSTCRRELRIFRENSWCRGFLNAIFEFLA